MIHDDFDNSVRAAETKESGLGWVDAGAGKVHAALPILPPRHSFIPAVDDLHLARGDDTLTLQADFRFLALLQLGCFFFTRSPLALLFSWCVSRLRLDEVARRRGSER